ncbi:hypothetical protein ACLBWZ_16120 [Brucellaceae bacterium C25G]
MSTIEQPKDQYLNDLMYIGNLAKEFELYEILSITIEQYNKRKAELEGEIPPWLN